MIKSASDKAYDKDYDKAYDKARSLPPLSLADYRGPAFRAFDAPRECGKIPACLLSSTPFWTSAWKVMKESNDAYRK